MFYNLTGVSEKKNRNLPNRGGDQSSQNLVLQSVQNGHVHSKTYGRVNAHVHEKVPVLFRESFNGTTIFLQSRNFLLDVFQEVRVGPIESKLPYMASTCCCDLLSQLN